MDICTIYSLGDVFGRLLYGDSIDGDSQDGIRS